MEKQFIDDFPTNRVNASTKILRRKTLSNMLHALKLKLQLIFSGVLIIPSWSWPSDLCSALNSNGFLA